MANPSFRQWISILHGKPTLKNSPEVSTQWALFGASNHPDLRETFLESSQP